MSDKILGVACFALSAATHVWIQHADTANLYSFFFFLLGAYEFITGIVNVRRQRAKKSAVES